MDLELLKDLEKQFDDKTLEHLKDVRELTEQIVELKKMCPHASIVYEYRSNSGNYDPHADCYWVQGECLDCKETFWYDSEKEPDNYRLVGMGNTLQVTPDEYKLLEKLNKI